MHLTVKPLIFFVFIHDKWLPLEGIICIPKWIKGGFPFRVQYAGSSLSQATGQDQIFCTKRACLRMQVVITTNYYNSTNRSLYHSRMFCRKSMPDNDSLRRAAINKRAGWSMWAPDHRKQLYELQTTHLERILWLPISTMNDVRTSPESPRA